MPLEINDVAISGFGTCTEKMIERYLVQSRSRGIGRNVSTDPFLQFVGANDHGQSIPPHQALDTPFHFLASGERGLLASGYRVLVRRGCGKGQINAGFTSGMQRELL